MSPCELLYFLVPFIMISDRNRGIHEITLVCQSLIVSLFFWGWVLLCEDDAIQCRSSMLYFSGCNASLLIGILAGGSLARVSSRLATPDFNIAIWCSARQWLICIFYLMLFNVSKERHPLLLFAIGFVSALFAVLFLTNRFLPSLLARLSFQGVSRERILIVGSSAKAQLLGKWLATKRMLGFVVVGLVTDELVSDSGNDLSVIGKLESQVERDRITNIILAELPNDDTLLRKVIDLCEYKGLRMTVMSDLQHKFGGFVTVHPDDDYFFLGLREEPLENPFNRFIKRSLDIAVSLPVVVFILPPLMAIVWLAQRHQSPGPVFFFQSRPGVRNQPFEICKLRTMHVNNPDNNKLPSSKDDPRIYPVGSFLRKTSLDEMPQFWNVLRGEMSVVGPRPHLTSQNQNFPHVYRKAYVRTFVKPGITGLSQVSGMRGDPKDAEGIRRRMQADIAYLENWSLRTDIRLILKTAQQVIFPPKTAI